MDRKDFIKQTTSFVALLSVTGIVPVLGHTEQKNIDMGQSKICATCGTQYPPSDSIEICEICKDDRQYIPASGQAWTSHESLLGSNSVRIGQINENVYELEITPRFAIGQRAFLIISKNGNILWDCFPLLNAPTIEFIKAKGGLRGIAFSHPHYYSNMKDWAKTFDCPIYIHKSDEKWIMERGEKLYLWEGEELPLWDDIRMINIGGHFPGSSILHVPFLSKEGTIFVGDTVYVSPSMKHMAVMFSYPNRIPLPKEEVRKVKKRFDKVPFDKLFGFYSYQNVTQNPKSIMEAFMNRYLGE